MNKFISYSIILFGLLVLSLSSPNLLLAEDINKTLTQVQEELESTKSQINTTVNALEAKIAEEQRVMRAERERLAVEVAERKLKAESLQAEFEFLKMQERELEAALENKRAMMDSIQATVSNNANLFLQSAPSYISQNLLAEQKNILENLVQTRTFPSLLSIETLLEVLQIEIYQGGEILKGKENIFNRDGQEVEAEILHLGAYQSYFNYNNEFGFTLRTRILEPLEIVPYVANKEESKFLQGAFSGNYILPIDVSKGELLLTPPKQYSVWTSIKESGLFGWCIIAIGILGFLLATERYFALSRIKLQGEQLANHILETPQDLNSLNNSPVGRVLRQMLYSENTDSSDRLQYIDPQVLERRAEEAMLKELPALEKFLNTIKIFAAISPLLGLLGTVSGIVTTFRIITTFGNSDPKLLSGGISEALLTTEMGLLAAIPLLLAHHFLNRKMNNIVLDMELAGSIVLKHFTKA